MDPTKMSIVYACYFCKDSFAFSKKELERHLNEEGCPKMDLYCNHVIIFETSEDLKTCRVYLNHLNVDMNLQETLKKLEWPSTMQYFFTKDEWHTVQSFNEQKYSVE